MALPLDSHSTSPLDSLPRQVSWGILILSTVLLLLTVWDTWARPPAVGILVKRFIPSLAALTLSSSSLCRPRFPQAAKALHVFGTVLALVFLLLFFLRLGE